MTERDHLDAAIILEPGDGSLFGEPAALLHEAVDAGILYVCPINDGTCPNGKHRGGPFLHYCKHRSPADYDRFVGIV